MHQKCPCLFAGCPKSSSPRALEEIESRWPLEANDPLGVDEGVATPGSSTDSDSSSDVFIK